MEYIAPRHPLHGLKLYSLRTAAAIALAAERLVRVPAPAGSPEEVLVLEYMLPLGACVLMTPVFEALHAQGRCVIVATRGAALELLRHSLFVDDLLETPDPLTNLPAATRSLRAQLRSRGLRPQAVLTGSFDQRTRIALLGMLACDGRRGGFTVIGDFYQRPLRYDPARSRLENNLRLTGLVGEASAALEPRVFFTPQQLEEARRLLAPIRQTGRPVLVAVSQTGRQHYGWWRSERWQQTLAYASGTLGFGVAHVGTEAEAHALAALQQLCGGISLAGATSLPVLAAVLTLADLVVAVDTGTMHLARAAGVPMVALAPSWQPAVQWMPLGLPQVRVLRGPDIVLPIPNDYQLDEITAEQVCAAMEDLFALYPPSEQAREARVQERLTSRDLL